MTEYSRRHRIKLGLTQALLENTPTLALTVEQAMTQWWMNTRQQGGYRLTPQGDEAFQTAEIECYEFVFRSGKDLVHRVNWLALLLDVDQVMDSPYYFYRVKGEPPRVRIYDSKTAMMVELYGGFEDYISSVKSNRKNSPLA